MPQDILTGDPRALRDLLTAAAARLDSGAPDEALTLLKSRGGIALANPVGLNMVGEAHLALDRASEALKSFDAALRMAPGFAEAHANRGAALEALGRLEEALEAEKRALRHRPRYAVAFYNRGNILAALGRTEEAIAAYGAALKERPDFAAALVNRGLALHTRGRPLDALADFRKAQKLNPGLAGAFIGAASAHRALGQIAEALAAADAALAAAPDHLEALVFKAGLLSSQERFAEALPIVDAALADGRESAAAHCVRSTILRGLKRFDEALANADAAVRIAPKDPVGHTARAMVLSELGRVDELVITLATAERLGARDHSYFHARAVALTETGDLDQADAAYRTALELEPAAANVHQHYGMLLLARGDFTRGWAEHEWRLKQADYRSFARVSQAPLWAGEPVSGKRILVLHEQGSGDTIQFARFILDLVERGAAVTLLSTRPLLGLLRRSFPAVDVTDALGLRAEFDFQVPVMSLPAVLGVTPDALPARVPYLTADPEKVDKWRRRLGGEGFRVGVVWQGNPAYLRDRLRSVPLAHYAPLAAVPGVRLISLQAFNGLDQLKTMPQGMRVEDFGVEISHNPDGFNEIAGLAMTLDLVVTSDTVTAHLAGALGVPTWVALRSRPDWRWMQQRPDSPWYPTMRLFRQERPTDWQGVFAAITAALAAAVGEKRSGQTADPAQWRK
jgi:tetratricopeptide (TPR) repeat protein